MRCNLGDRIADATGRVNNDELFTACASQRILHEAKCVDFDRRRYFVTVSRLRPHRDRRLIWVEIYGFYRLSRPNGGCGERSGQSGLTHPAFLTDERDDNCHLHDPSEPRLQRRCPTSQPPALLGLGAWSFPLRCQQNMTWMRTLVHKLVCGYLRSLPLDSATKPKPRSVQPRIAASARHDEVGRCEATLVLRIVPKNPIDHLVLITEPHQVCADGAEQQLLGAWIDLRVFAPRGLLRQPSQDA